MRDLQQRSSTRQQFASLMVGWPIAQKNSSADSSAWDRHGSAGASGETDRAGFCAPHPGAVGMPCRSGLTLYQEAISFSLGVLLTVCRRSVDQHLEPRDTERWRACGDR
jgi:hypothetical protein